MEVKKNKSSVEMRLIANKKELFLLIFLISFVLFGSAFVLIKTENQIIMNLIPEQLKPMILGAEEEPQFVELLVKTSDNKGTSDIAEERRGNAKQGYVILTKPEGWNWGVDEINPLKFAIVKIPASEWNESWLEPELDYSKPIMDEENKSTGEYETLTQRKYRLPLESFMNSSLQNLKDKPYGYNWESEIASYRTTFLDEEEIIIITNKSSNDILNQTNNRTGIYNTTSKSFISESGISYLARLNFSVSETIANISDKIELVNWEEKPIDWKSHGSSGMFIISLNVSGDANYTSLSAWETGEDGDIRATGPCIANITGAWASADTTGFVINAWETNASGYILITTDEDNRAVKTGRDTSRYRLEGTNERTMDIREDYVRVENLQISSNASGTTSQSIYIIPDAGGDIRISNCRISSFGASANSGLYMIDNTNGILKIWNCIFENFVSDGIRINPTSSGIYNNIVYNNTADGIEFDGGAGTVINNAVFNNGDDFDIAGGTSGTINHCASDDLDGADNRTAAGGDWDTEFVDSANGDFTLLIGGNLINNGTADPSSGIFTDDIDNESRPSMMGVWDIGVDEYNYAPNINFTEPTPENASTQSATAVFVNVSVNDTDEVSAWIDWNRSLVGWWNFESYNDTGVYDNSSYDNFGTFTGGANVSNVTTGIRGNAFELDGASDYIDIADTPSLELNNISVSVWVNFDDVTDTDYHIVSKRSAGDDSWLLEYGLDTANQISFVIDTGSPLGATWSTTPAINTWYHVVGTWNGTDIDLYINGIKEGTQAQTGSMDDLAYGVRIGSKPDGALRLFNGTLDEVLIFNRALNGTEVKALYDAGSIELTANFTNLPEATYNYTAWAIDSGGNINSTEQRVVTIGAPIGDTTNPVVDLKSPTNNNNLSTNIIDFNCSASDNVNLTNVTLYGNWTGSWHSNETNSSGLNASEYVFSKTISDGDGYYIWNCEASDNSSNTAFNDTNWTFTIDTTVPDINITIPSNNSNSSDTGIDIEFTNTDLTLEATWYSNDTMLRNYSLGTGGSYVNITNITWDEGHHNVTVWSNDSVGNENSSIISFTIDTIKPNVNITTPLNNTNWTDTGIDIEYTRSDTNLESAWYSNDTYERNYSLGDIGSFVNITNITWAEGHHNVTVWVNDSSNNENYSIISFLIDTTPPYFTNRSNVSIYDNQSVAQDYNATDDGVGFDNWTVNESAFDINASGWLKNISGLSIKQHWINITINDTLNNLNSTIILVNVSNSTVGDVTPPNVTFSKQVPTDINAFNIMSVKLNVSYNISDLNLNASTVTFYEKINSTSEDTPGIFINGTEATSGFVSGFSDDSNISHTWTFELDDNDVYPATYNFNETFMELESHSIYDLDANGKYIKIRFFNVSNVKNFSFLEIMANTSGNKALRVYYCNETYTTGSPTTVETCTNFFNFEATGTYNHTHTVNSSHQFIPFAINQSGYIGDVFVTNISYFLLRGRSGAHAWDIHYISNVSRVDTIQTSIDGGGSYSDFSGTVDAHLHQFDGTDQLHYYVCANDTANNQNCSVLRSDTLDIGGLPPSSPDVYNPTNQVYGGNISINYTAALSPSGISLSFYNITLLNSSEDYNITIQANNSLNLSYIWDSTDVLDGEYIIKVTVNDTEGGSSFGLSENFTADNTPPYFTSTTNVSIFQNESVEQDLDATDNIQFGYWAVNDSNFAINTTGGLTNVSGLSAQEYWVNVTINDTVNNINSTIILVNVSAVLDTTPPTFDNLQNHSQAANISFSFDLDASDDTAVDSFVLNDTDYFTIDVGTGVITNATNLSRIEIHWLNVTINDTSNNLNSGVFYINITEVAVAMAYRVLSTCSKDLSVVYDNLRIPLIRSWGC